MVKEIGRQLKALETSSWLGFSGETGVCRQQWFSKIYYEGLTAVKDAKGRACDSSHLFCGTVCPFENYYFTPNIYQISNSPEK